MTSWRNSAPTDTALHMGNATSWSSPRLPIYNPACLSVLSSAQEQDHWPPSLTWLRDFFSIYSVSIEWSVPLPTEQQHTVLLSCLHIRGKWGVVLFRGVQDDSHVPWGCRSSDTAHAVCAISIARKTGSQRHSASFSGCFILSCPNSGSWGVPTGSFFHKVLSRDICKPPFSFCACMTELKNPHGFPLNTPLPQIFRLFR